jgi:hypothetical protein
MKSKIHRKILFVFILVLLINKSYSAKYDKISNNDIYESSSFLLRYL